MGYKRAERLSNRARFPASQTREAQFVGSAPPAYKAVRIPGARPGTYGTRNGHLLAVCVYKVMT